MCTTIHGFCNNTPTISIMRKQKDKLIAMLKIMFPIQMEATGSLVTKSCLNSSTSKHEKYGLTTFLQKQQ